MVEAAVPRNGGLPLVSFAPPTPEWAGKQTNPALNLFLFDIREDLSGRGGDEVDVRDDQGQIIGRQPPVRRYQLSYLVSAWAKDAEEEHQMLGAILATVPNSAAIPDEHLKGRLVEQGLTVRVEVGVPVSGAQAWDLWSALGTPPRTALEIVVTAPLLPDLRTDLAPPARKLDLGVSKEQPGALGGPPVPVAETPAPARAAPASGPGSKRGKAKAQPEAETGEAPPPLGARPGKRWATFKVREHVPTEPGE